jgi:hypothetical protein
MSVMTFSTGKAGGIPKPPERGRSPDASPLFQRGSPAEGGAWGFQGVNLVLRAPKLRFDLLGNPFVSKPSTRAVSTPPERQSLLGHTGRAGGFGKPLKYSKKTCRTAGIVPFSKVQTGQEDSGARPWHVTVT